MKTIQPGTRRIIPAALASALTSFTVALAACAIAHDANAAAPASDGDNASAGMAATLATAKLFDRVVEQPAKLRIFLQAMPKGGDLHNHLSGSPYAEDYLQWAAADGSCISRSKRAIVAPPCS
ncbi:MAG TPA: hypothetical protein VNX00_00735, partial [Herbaspirillum sp.]|nr:hypothetical protein [Herbaspirillum sp.]